MAGDSCSEGCGFESMDIFSHLLVVQIVMFVWKDKINEKEAGDGP